MRLVSWNVNGLRAALRGGFAGFLETVQPDILCLQETKAGEDHIDAALFRGCHVSWNPARKPGYSGVALISRTPPLRITSGLGIDEHDGEGRVLVAEFPEFFVLNVYTPNSQRGLVRLPYRMRWDEVFRKFVRQLDRRKPVLLCGDLNCAHAEIDLANPRENRRNAGFTDEERTGLTRLLEAGLVDSFRELHPGERGHYSWWTYRAQARARNIGWRLDYWLVSRRFWPRVAGASILADITGSDHCPVLLEVREDPPVPNGNAGSARSRKRSGA
jgi:exodeoxyribonuclease-3